MTTLSERYKQILDEQFTSYRDTVRQRMEQNGQVATGRTKRSVVEKVSSSDAKLVGARYITTLRDGVRPGAFPPISAIQEWINAKGLNLNAYAVRTNLFKLGSRLHQGSDPRFSKPTDTLSFNVQDVARELGFKINEANADAVRSTFKDGNKIKIDIL